MASDYDPNALKPGTKIAGYEILRVIGAGGFGITYEAESPVTGKHVAIKEFFPRGIASRESSTRIVFATRDIDIVQWALKRFESSTTDQCKLKHPNIVEVIHYLQENDTGYMIMEFVEGKTLEQWLRERKKPPSLDELRPIMAPVLDALIYLHKQKLIHRDIAPDNIMIKPDGRPLIIDFGAIKVIEQQTQIRSKTNRSFTVSKQFYSPPEQVQENSDQLDVRADVYATGATIYRALAGRPPSASEERTQQIAFGNGDPFQPLGKLTPQLPAEVAAAIDHALAFQAKDRLGSIAELRDALKWGDAKIGSAVRTPTAVTAPAHTFSARSEYAPVQEPDRPKQTPMRWVLPLAGVAAVAAAIIIVAGFNPLNLFNARGPAVIVQQPPPVLTREPQKVEPPVAPVVQQQQAKKDEPVVTPAPAQQPQTPAKVEPKADPQENARRDYELAQRVDTIVAYEQFLARYPEGYYAALARAQRQKLFAAEAVEVTKKLNVELRRVGCSVASGDAEWSQASRNALQAFNQHAQTRFDINTPTAAALDAVRGRTDRVCPLVCAAGQRPQGDTCVAIPATVQQQRPAPAVRPQQQQPQAQQPQGKQKKFSCRWGDAAAGEYPHRQVCGFF
jgi:serine/threonine protein kinase